jgi:hypothetical protein
VVASLPECVVCSKVSLRSPMSRDEKSLRFLLALLLETRDLKGHDSKGIMRSSLTFALTLAPRTLLLVFPDAKPVEVLHPLATIH